MKIMHTADWHLGDKINGYNRIQEQKEIAQELINIVEKEDIDIVVISGDIYNNAIPTSEAEELFFETVEKMSRDGNTVVFAISGNHDDPERLQAARGIAYTHNIILTGELDLSGKKYRKDRDIQIVDAGYGYIKIQKAEEKVTLAFLPYKNNSYAEGDDQELSYAEKVKKWIEKGVSKFTPDSFNMLAMHVFIAGSKIKGKEIYVGGMLSVPRTICEEADYVALGHMHANQKLGDNVYYSGATISRHPISSQPSVNILNVTGNKLESVEVVKLNSPVKFTKLIVEDITEAEEKLTEFQDRDIVELVFKTNEPISAMSLKELKKQYKCVRAISFELKSKPEEVNNKKLKELSGEELFSRFYTKQKGVSPRKELVDFFMDCGGDNSETN